MVRKLKLIPGVGPEIDDSFSHSELALTCRVSQRTLQIWVRRGWVRAYRYGRDRRYAADEVKRWLAIVQPLMPRTAWFKGEDWYSSDSAARRALAHVMAARRPRAAKAASSEPRSEPRSEPERPPLGPMPDIRDGVPCPLRYQHVRRYPFSAMEVDQHVIFPLEEDVKRQQSRISRVMAYEKIRNLGRQYTMQRRVDGFYVWRIA